LKDDWRGKTALGGSFFGGPERRHRLDATVVLEEMENRFSPTYTPTAPAAALQAQLFLSPQPTTASRSSW